MSDDVVSTLKPDPQDCVCGCGKVGQPRVRQWQDGLGPHVKACQCRRCGAPKYKDRAYKRERRIAKAVGGERSVMSGALNGADVTGCVDVEETAGQAYARGLFRWWDSKGVQTKLARLMQRTLVPRAFVVWQGKRGLVVMTFEDWAELVQRGMSDADGGAA